MLCYSILMVRPQRLTGVNPTIVAFLLTTQKQRLFKLVNLPLTYLKYNSPQINSIHKHNLSRNLNYTRFAMCTQVNMSYRCIKCNKEMRQGKDYKMCSKGRKANKWGACGMSAVEMRPIPDGTCGECLKEQKK